MRTPFSEERDPRGLPGETSGVHTPEALHYIILRERARAERSGAPLALLVFRIPRVDVELSTTVFRVILERKRITDEVGWYQDAGIGLVLPDTSPSGARVVAEDVCARLQTQLPYTIYCYPLDSSGIGEGRDKRLFETVRLGAQQWGVTCRDILDLQSSFAVGIPLWKRALDMAGALGGLILLSPLFAVVALFIKVVSPGPVFFRQERIGYAGRRFNLLKFRSMRVQADPEVHAQHLSQLLQSDVPMTKLDADHDSRVIPLGNLLRNSYIDELPQLINVLKGEMSLVGPRPCIPYEAERYQLWQTRRFDVLPGMTGLWQINGKNETTFKEMVRLDIKYATRLHPIREAGILLRTIPAVFRQGLRCLQRHPAKAPLQALPTPRVNASAIISILAFSWTLVSGGAALAYQAPQSVDTQTPAELPEYVIQSGDILEVFVWKEPELSRKVLVRPDGRISFPLVQDLQAANVCPSELKRAIEDRLRQFISAPNVTVVVDTIRSYVVFVVGKVQKPGEYMREQPVSVLQALALAGGFQEYAERGSITIFRSTVRGNLVFRFDYDDVVRGKNASQNIRLESGDVVVVP